MPRYWPENEVGESLGAPIEAESEEEALAEAKKRYKEATQVSQIESGKGGRV